MATISDYLTSLQNDLATAKTNLANLGVEVLETDTFTEISEKMANIETGGGSITDFLLLEAEPTHYLNNAYHNTGLLSILKEIPAIKWNGVYENGATQYSLSNYFLGATNLKKIDLSNFENMDKVNSMSYMFYSCDNLEEIIGIDNFSFDNLTYVSYMFDGCRSLKNVNNFIKKISNQTILYIASMFRNCEAIEDITFDENFLDPTYTSGVTMETFCSNCLSLKTINIPCSGYISGMRYAFQNCRELTTINMSNLDFTPIRGNTSSSSSTDVFAGNIKLENLSFGLNYGAGFTTSLSANNRYATLDLSACTLLTHDSLMDVINKLYDLTANGKNNQKLVIGTTNMAKLTEEEIAIATNKGWIVS